MGTPVGEFEYGRDCLDCYGEGHTPLRVWAHFANIERCESYEGPLPNGMTFEMFQDPDYSCEWKKYDPAGWSVWFRIETDYSQLWCFWQSFLVFRSIAYDHCPLILTNDDSCISMYGFNGKGWITYPVNPIPLKLALTYGITGMSKVLYDITPCGIDHSVVKLCRKSDKTNVLILTDDQEF